MSAIRRGSGRTISTSTSATIMKPEPASQSGASASPSRCLPDSSGLNTAGPRIAPNTAPKSTSAMPCALRSGGYMSPAAVRASSAVPLAMPIRTNAANTRTALSDAEPAAATTPPTAPVAKPAASTGTLPTRSIARPAKGAASAPQASTIAGPSPSRPSMSSTWTSVIDATAACSCSMPEFAASEADRSAVLRRIGRPDTGPPSVPGAGQVVVGRMRQRLRVLRHRDFRNLWLGQSASAIGDAVVIVAIALYVTELTGDPTQVGIVLAAYLFPLIGFLLVGGVWADRLPRERVMIAADVVRAALQTTLAVLIFTGAIHIWQMAVIQACYGTAQAFFQPAYTGIVPRTVP